MQRREQAILLLAAGGSRRMGQPKQLLRYNNQSIISHLLTLLCSQERPVYVVVGAAEEEVRKELTNYPVTIITNAEWEKGMGSSLRIGLAEIVTREKQVRQVLFTVVDQVFLSQSVLDQFWERSLLHDLVAARYENGEVGVPALFSAAYFPELLKLKNEQGAKPLLRRYERQIKYVNFPKGNFDLDYPQDWISFLEKLHPQLVMEEE